MIDGPCKNQWTPIQYEGKPVQELELKTEHDTLARYERSPVSDAPGIFAYRFIGELESIA